MEPQPDVFKLLSSNSYLRRFAWLHSSERATQTSKSTKQTKPNKIPGLPKTLSSSSFRFQSLCNQLCLCVSNFGIRQFIAHLQTSCFPSRPHTYIVAAPATYSTVFTNENGECNHDVIIKCFIQQIIFRFSFRHQRFEEEEKCCLFLFTT
jgi:hypothetical protein